MRMPRLVLAAPVAALALGLTACGGGSNGAAVTAANTSGPPSSTASAGGPITVGSANFSEDELIADMYIAVLTKGGYTVNSKLNIGSREVYLKAMGAGEVDLVPDYVGTLGQVLNQAQNGKDANTANPVAAGDPQKTVQNIQPLLDKADLTVFGLSPAQDQNSYAVTKATAEKNTLAKLSDITPALAQSWTFGGPPECQTRPQCIMGLKNTYGLTFGSFKTLDAGGPLTIKALTDGTINIGLVFSSDGAVAANNLVVLKDDKGLTPADNIIALARKGAVDEKAQQLVTQVDEALTTEDLQQLNKQIGVDKADPKAVAEQFLKDKGLL